MTRAPRLFRRLPISYLDNTILTKISESGLHAGFPSPASDYVSERINLTKELVPNPDYTELVEVSWGDCCIDRHVFKGCLLLIDFTMLPENGNLVYVRYGDDDMVRVFCVEHGKIVLRTANARKTYPPINMSEAEHLEIRGVVTKIIVDPRKSGLP